MVWIRGYPRYYDDPYARRGWGYRRRPRAGGSCLRDACLLESGCCLAEALDGNCLMAAVLLLPQLWRATPTTLPADPAAPPAGGRRAGRAGRAMLAGIRLYQTEISAHRDAVCRFTPSCSHYAAEAIQTHGAARGATLAVRRLLRCRPGGRRGADPVPHAGSTA